MPITSYTSYAEIRSVCGLSEKELPDAELGLELYENSLMLQLEGVILPVAIGTDLSTKFLAVQDILAAERTVTEQRLYNLTRMFCTYAVALDAVVSLSIKAAKSIGDGKASLVRFSPESAYKDVIKRIEQKLDEMRAKIEQLGSTVAVSASLFSVAKPAINQVTNS